MLNKAFFSIIVPVRNEEKHIRRCLSSLVGQDYDPKRYEIIVVDGMSTDGTRKIVGEFVKAHQNLHLLDNPKLFVPAALNIGLRKARGEVIIRVDGHAYVGRNYLSACLRALEDTRADCVGGTIQSINSKGNGNVITLAMSSTFGVGNAYFRTSKKMGYVDTVAFGAYQRRVFERIGCFDETLVRCQDDELNYRLKKAGGKIYLHPDIQAFYYSRDDLRSLWKQYFQYGYWKVRVLQKHPRQMCLRQFVPPALVSALLGSALLSFFSTYGVILLGLVVGAYLLANLLGSLWTAARVGWRNLFLLPLVYAILHIGYGLGFLVGLMRFAHRWGDRQGKVPAFRNTCDATVEATFPAA